MKHTFYRNKLNQVIKNRAYTYYKTGETYQQPGSLTLCVGAGGDEKYDIRLSEMVADFSGSEA
jgi:hypothetical protein